MAKKKSTPKKETAKETTRETPATRKRVSFSISSDPDTVEGRIVEHLRNNKMVNMRESVVRALKAYYLPWAYEDDVSKEEAQVLARGAIDELEFRIFQIRRHFLAGEAYGPKLTESLAGSPPTANDSSTTSYDRLSPDAIVEKVTPPPARNIEPNPDALSDILDNQDIDPDVLDDF